MLGAFFLVLEFLIKPNIHQLIAGQFPVIVVCVTPRTDPRDQFECVCFDFCLNIGKDHKKYTQK